MSGPHRNRALAAARHARAVELATAGFTYEQIAAELGYANRGTVHRIVAQALRRETVEAVDELRRLELDRLDSLQRSLWAAAMEEDIEAAKTVARIVESLWPARAGPVGAKRCARNAGLTGELHLSRLDSHLWTEEIAHPDALADAEPVAISIERDGLVAHAAGPGVGPTKRRTGA